MEKDGESVPVQEKKPRFSYSEGAFASNFKDSGVKKLIILAIGEDVYENYTNIKVLLDLIKIDDIEYINACVIRTLVSYRVAVT